MVSLDSTTTLCIGVPAGEYSHFYPNKFGGFALRTSTTATTMRIEWVRVVMSSATVGMSRVPTGGALRILVVIVILHMLCMKKVMLGGMFIQIPTGVY